MIEESISQRRGLMREDHPEIATAHNNLGELLHEQGATKQAEAQFRRSLEIWMSVAGPDHLETAISMHNLGATLRDQHRYGEAEELYGRALRAFTAELGVDHPKVAAVSEAYEQTRRIARIAAAGVPSGGGSF